ncbi:MaoC family dehydratase [Rothia sp. P13129]|uniref:MaoC family dehydratase n=1 Tax=Rothia sp. P13129 TaxID=3402664 RepID=UPI003AC83D3B
MKPTFNTLEKGENIGNTSFSISRADLIKYAGASGDYNPIHWNERFAQSVGLPGVIAHGMYTMGLAINLVSEWATDPGAIIDYQCRFSKPVIVPDAPAQQNPQEPTATVHVSGKIAELYPDTQQTRIDLTVTTTDENGKEQKVLLKAQAIVQL